MIESKSIHLSDARAAEFGYHYDEAAADDAVNFFKRCLRLTIGRWAGDPFVLLPWQENEVIRPLFGWKREDGTRRFRRGSIWIPKKNGKSSLAAGLILYMLLGNEEAAAEVYTAACDRDQASIIYRECARMVRKSPALSDRLRCVDSTKTIAYAKGGGYYKALSADVPTKEGLNAYCVIIDELHAHKSRTLFDTLYYSGVARDQPLQLAISTAGEYDPESVGYKEYLYAKKVLSGELEDPEYFAFISEADPADDWTDPETARRANPSYGEIIREEDIISDIRRAKEDSSLENAYKRYRLNLWTESIDLWMPAEIWSKNTGAVNEEDIAGRACYGGLDLSSRVDITAWLMIFPPDEEHEKWIILPRFFTPEDSMRNRESLDRAPYGAWAHKGFLKATPGNAVDYDFVKARILEDSKKFDIKEICYDPWNAMQLALQLTDEGITMVEVRQGPGSLSNSMKDLKGKALDGALAHGGNPVLAWMAGNVVARADENGNIAPSKRKSTGRIDGMSALITANTRAMALIETDKVYEHSGFFF